MESEVQPKPAWKEISHVGVVVEDVEEAARKLEELIGIGPFKILEPQYRDLTYQGKPGKYKIKIGLAKAGASGKPSKSWTRTDTSTTPRLRWENY